MALGGMERTERVEKRGLARGGVAPADASHYLSVFERRAESGRTGATWQRAALASCGWEADRDEAIARMFGHYLERSRGGEPVAQWSLPA